MNKYELFYDIGGHGGPYIGFKEAKKAAKRLLAGCDSMNTVHILTYKEWARNTGIMKASHVETKVKRCQFCGTIK